MSDVVAPMKREAPTRAEAFAAGDHDSRRAELQAQMQAAAKALAYEQASACKTRLTRLAAFEQEGYRWVAPAERFAYLLLQRGAGVRECRAFLVCRSAIQYAGAVAYPLEEKPLAEILKTMRWLCSTDPPVDEAGRLRMGLVARTLFAGGDRRGAVVPWREDLSPADLAEAIETHREILHLRAPKKKKSRDAGDAGDKKE